MLNLGSPVGTMATQNGFLHCTNRGNTDTPRITRPNQGKIRGSPSSALRGLRGPIFMGIHPGGIPTPHTNFHQNPSPLLEPALWMTRKGCVKRTLLKCPTSCKEKVAKKKGEKLENYSRNYYACRVVAGGYSEESFVTKTQSLLWQKWLRASKTCSS